MPKLLLLLSCCPPPLACLSTKLMTPTAQILKTDIEGFEWEVFDDFFARGEPMPFSQILVGHLRTNWTAQTSMPLPSPQVSLRGF